MSVFLSDFLLDCEIKGLRPATIRGYKYKIEKYLSEYEITDADVKRFILDSKEKGLHVESINSYLRAIRVFSSFCGNEVNIKLLKDDCPVKEIYSTEEIRKLIKKPKGKNFIEFRTWALICFLLGTGCRIGTVKEIRVEDVDLDAGCVFLSHLKNRKKQYYPLSKALVVVLKEYIRVRGNEGYLFCNSFGEQANDRTLQEQIRKYNLNRGVKKTSCHLFRHTFAANYIMNGGDAFRLQKLLGHSTLDMTRKYVNIYGQEIGKDIEKYSALDNNIRQKIEMNKTNY